MNHTPFLPSSRFAIHWVAPVILAAAFLLTTIAGGAIIWNGPTMAFTNFPGTDPMQPTNQDRVSTNVWLTRASTQGLFNAKLESSYTSHLSPRNTAWAYGQLTHYASLTYTDWQTWNGSSPPSMVGKDAVVHLTAEDIYLSIRFTSWGGNGGGFSYLRSTPAPSAPPTLAGLTLSNNGAFQLTFTNTPGLTFAVLGATNLSLSLTDWPVLGLVTDAPSGSGCYRFADPGAGTNRPQRFYRVRWP